VGMEAFHPCPSPGHSTGGAWCSIIGVEEGIPKLGVATMRILDGHCRDFGLGAPDTSSSLELAHTSIEFGVAQPEQRGHRSSVEEIRSVSDDTWHSVGVANDDFIFADRLSSEPIAHQ